jgi:hypothetical protein
MDSLIPMILMLLMMMMMMMILHTYHPYGKEDDVLKLNRRSTDINMYFCGGQRR